MHMAGCCLVLCHKLMGLVSVGAKSSVAVCRAPKIRKDATSVGQVILSPINFTVHQQGC